MKYNNIKVVKRNDNRWFARITINGKQKSIYGKTQLECYNNLKLAFKNKDRIIKTIEYKTLKLYDWLEQWYKIYKTPKLKPKSLYQIRNCIDRHIKPNIENLSLNKIIPIDINNALNKIQSSRMKKYTYDCYVESLRQAYKNQLIDKNISELIDNVIHIRQKGKSLTREQRKIFLNATKKLKYGKIFEFMLYSGCRPQGAKNLKWEDIKEDKIFINETKSKNGQRYIPYFNNIKNLLNSIEQKNDYVFPISETTIKKEFIKLKELCNFEFTQKDLRHTFASICGEIGIDDMTLAKWMGHGNPNTTKQYYREILTDFENEQIKEINSKFDTKLDTKSQN